MADPEPAADAGAPEGAGDDAGDAVTAGGGPRDADGGPQGAGGDAALALLHAPPDLRLDGRAAWVTGASRGLGRALAFALSGAGAELLLSARDEAALGEVVDAIAAAGGRALAAPASVTDPDALRRAADLAERTWERLDVLVNNAGISPSFDRAEVIDPAEFERTLAVNATGALRCCQVAADLLGSAPRGASVVNVSSIHGTHAHERLVAYSASKAAIELTSRTLALEWAPRGIRVNCVAPGYIETDMTRGLMDSERHRTALLERIPLGRFAQVQEIVGAVLFCAGDAGRYMTGATLTLDGGWSAR